MVVDQDPSAFWWLLDTIFSVHLTGHTPVSTAAFGMCLELPKVSGTQVAISPTTFVLVEVLEEKQLPHRLSRQTSLAVPSGSSGSFERFWKLLDCWFAILCPRHPHPSSHGLSTWLLLLDSRQGSLTIWSRHVLSEFALAERFPLCQTPKPGSRKTTEALCFSPPETLHDHQERAVFR